VLSRFIQTIKPITKITARITTIIITVNRSIADVFGIIVAEGRGVTLGACVITGDAVGLKIGLTVDVGVGVSVALIIVGKGVGVIVAYMSALNCHVLSTSQLPEAETKEIEQKKIKNTNATNVLVRICIIPSVTARSHLTFMEPSFPTRKDNHRKT